MSVAQQILDDVALDHARAKEACRLAGHTNTAQIAETAARLARQGWTPPDTLLVRAREIAADVWENDSCTWGKRVATQIREGGRDADTSVKIALAALRDAASTRSALRIHA